jgi:hypothetical protein
MARYTILFNPLFSVVLEPPEGRELILYWTHCSLFASLVTSLHRFSMQVSSVDCRPTSLSWRHCILHSLGTCIHKSTAWVDCFKRRPALHACVTCGHAQGIGCWPSQISNSVVNISKDHKPSIIYSVYLFTNGLFNDAVTTVI